MNSIKASSRFVNVGGIKTHYYDAGDGLVVVLLHSGEFGASAELSWEGSIDCLAQHFRVVAPDWLGFGETDKIRDFVSGSERMLRHMVAFLDVLAIEEADFVGTSMGGTVLLKEAASPHCRFPIRNMVVASGGGLVIDNDARRLSLAYDGTADAMRDVLSVMFEDQKWVEDDAYVARRVAASLAPGAWEAVASARFKSPQTPPRSEFGQPDTIAYERIPFRTLGIAGKQDKLREPGYHEVFHRIPNGRAQVLEEAGHLLNIEQAGVFNDLVLRFLHGDDLMDAAQSSEEPVCTSEITNRGVL
jgi:2-hydroxymuconate-semialdehyde hydrolase